MATTTPATKTVKIKPEAKPLITRIEDQLSRAVLSRKITVEQLTALSERITKLTAFLK